MGRSAITIGHPHNGGALVVVHGPGVPIQDQKDRIRAHNVSREHPEFSRVELWTSDSGRIRTYKFRKPSESEPAKKAKK